MRVQARARTPKRDVCMCIPFIASNPLQGQGIRRQIMTGDATAPDQAPKMSHNYQVQHLDLLIMLDHRHTKPHNTKVK